MDYAPNGIVLVIGSSVIDLKGKPLKKPVSGTSNAGEIRASVGGSARNIAENLARLGLAVRLLSAVGEDGFGQLILSQTATCGVDVSGVIRDPDLPSASYLALLNEDGSLAVSIDDMRITSRLDRALILRHREAFRQACCVVVDTNLVPSALTTVFQLSRQYGLRVCANPVSLGLAGRLKKCLAQCTLVCCNRHEAQALSGICINSAETALQAAQTLVTLGVEIALITLETDGLVYATSAASGKVPALPVEVVDRTGGGDALTAAVIYSLINDFPLDEAMRLGVSAEALTVSSKDTVSPDLSLESLYQTLLI